MALYYVSEKNSFPFSVLRLWHYCAHSSKTLVMIMIIILLKMIEWCPILIKFLLQIFNGHRLVANARRSRRRPFHCRWHGGFFAFPFGQSQHFGTEKIHVLYSSEWTVHHMCFFVHSLPKCANWLNKFGLIITGSIAGTSKGITFREHAVVHGQSSRPNATIHEERTNGCYALTFDDGHVHR